MLKQIGIILFAVLVIFDASAKDYKETSSKLPVKLLKYHKCKQRKKDNISYCVDENNQKITAELRKYEDGVLISSIPVINSLIDGTVKSYNLSGDVISEKKYQKGKLNGLSTTYFDNKLIETQIPYQNGLKEGVAKYYYEDGSMQTQCTFINNKLDGQLRRYTKEGEILFDIITAQNSHIEGICAYLDENNKIKKQNIPEILLEAVNQKCIEFGTELSSKCCSINTTKVLETCNKKWLKNNITTLKNYIKSCNQ